MFIPRNACIWRVLLSLFAYLLQKLPWVMLGESPALLFSSTSFCCPSTQWVALYGPGYTQSSGAAGPEPSARQNPFQQGSVASTPTWYCVLWTCQSKSVLNWASLHFVLFCSIDMPPVYKCHNSFTKHRRFKSLLLVLCQYSRYISLGSDI